MSVFDIHTHIFPDPIARRTVDKLGRIAKIKPSYDGTRQGLQESMAEAGINGALNCPIATKPEQVESILRWASQTSRWPILNLASIHPNSANPEEILQNVAKAGLAGIKLHPEYQEFTLDDPRMIPIWRTCRDLDLLIMLHAGADIAFSPPFRTSPATIAELLEKYPGIKLIAAHFGSWNMWDEVMNTIAGSTALIDTSFTMGLLDDEKFVELARRHGVDKVLFGTDTPWRSQKSDLQHFLSLPLTEEEKQMILWDNAARLLKF